MNKKESGIDQVNEKIWNDRFKDLQAAEKAAFINLEAAENALYLKGVAEAKLNIAAVCFYSSENEKAAKYLSEASTWFKENTREKGYVRTLLLEGNIFESLGDYEKTMSLWLSALKVAQEIYDEESEAEAYSQLGLIYSRLSDYPRSLEYLNSGLKIREKLNDENAVASSLNRIGMVLRQNKKYSESLGYYFRSLDIRKKNDQLSAIPWTLLGIGNTLEDSGRADEALSYYQQGAGGSDRRCVLQCKLGSGRIYSTRKENRKAEKLLNESLEITKSLNTKYLAAEVYSALAKHYESAGQDKKALLNYKLYHQTREALMNEESQRRLRNIEITSAVEKSESEKEIYRLKNVELKKAYSIIEEKNTDITASIKYASRIQKAILPGLDELNGHNENIFILFLPKDIVSGDFYWFTEEQDKLILVAGDCTGHGVPGALMSMLGISSLENIVKRRSIIKTDVILNELSREIRRSLHQNEGTETKDGMDISVCSIDRENGTLSYSGANNNLYLIRNNELIEYKADRMPAGYHDAATSDFSAHYISLIPGDMIYMYSDGFADQFGGPRNKKYKYSALKELLLKIYKLQPGIQKIKLEEEFYSWKAENTQVDDVLIIGYRF